MEAGEILRDRATMKEVLHRGKVAADVFRELVLLNRSEDLGKVIGRDNPLAFRIILLERLLDLLLLQALKRKRKSPPTMLGAAGGAKGSERGTLRSWEKFG